jgi:hypothetical protein
LKVPWGDIDWILDKIPNVDWHFVGCIGPELRSLSSFSRITKGLQGASFARIFDSRTPNHLENSLLVQRQSEAEKLQAITINFSDYELLSTIDRIFDFVTSIDQRSESLVLDISSFPKRWFFLLVRLLFERTNLKNFVVTYSSGDKYDNTLSFDPEFARALPSFASLESRSSCDLAFVSIGYHSSGLKEILKLEPPREIKVLFPFPPGQPGLMRNWESTRYLEQISNQETPDEDGVYADRLTSVQHDALDVSQCFELLSSLTDGGNKQSLLAPYGPKPISLAMCLFALACERSSKPEVPVYYSQPTAYSFNYTAGPQVIAGLPKVTAYPVILNGRFLYTV